VTSRYRARFLGTKKAKSKTLQFGFWNVWGDNDIVSQQRMRRSLITESVIYLVSGGESIE
jgi:hypothetical protein